ncbi:MAG TPA: hypothetical protein VMU78_00220 [Methylocella sp.]|nr:hypothetical protein [Methylocella sp.]
MDSKRVSIVSVAALLALTATASAAPMSVTSSKLIAPPQAQVEPVAYHYYRHHYRHYAWHRGWHYGWYRTRYHHYGWYHHRYYRYYGYYNPGAAVAGAALGLATLPFALAGGWPYYGYPYGYYGPSYYYY